MMTNTNSAPSETATETAQIAEFRQSFQFPAEKIHVSHANCTHGPGAPRRRCRETQAARYFVDYAITFAERTGDTLTPKLVRQLMIDHANGFYSISLTTLDRVLAQLPR